MNPDMSLFIVIISIVGGLAIVATIVGGVVAIVRIATLHRERMARIGMGLNPDGPEPPSELPSGYSSLPTTAAESDRFAASGPQSSPSV